MNSLIKIAKIFDLIGRISPIIILGKMFMQELRKIKKRINLHTRWLILRPEFILKDLLIPRHIFNHIENRERAQNHSFAKNTMHSLFLY